MLFLYSSCFLPHSGVHPTNELWHPLHYKMIQCSAGLSTSLLEVDLNKGHLFVYVSVNLVCRSLNGHPYSRSSLFLKCFNCRKSSRHKTELGALEPWFTILQHQASLQNSVDPKTGHFHSEVSIAGVTKNSLF